jgi:hypothetical protein
MFRANGSSRFAIGVFMSNLLDTIIYKNFILRDGGLTFTIGGFPNRTRNEIFKASVKSA